MNLNAYRDPIRTWLVDFRAKYGDECTRDVVRLIARVIAWMAEEPAGRR